MSFRSEIEDTLTEIAGVEGEDDSGVIRNVLITSTGRELPWIPNMEGVSSEIQIGPHVEVIQASGNILKRYFVTADTTEVTADSEVILADNSTARPRPGGTATRAAGFRGKTYRVLKVWEDTSGAYFKIILGSAR